jgi:FkbM family methyltransferase
MTIVSYAQNGEDVLLDRVFPRGKPGFYIDVGASDPQVASVTKHFYDLGWRGINIEPTTGSFERLVAERSRDVNLNVALSDRTGEMAFHEFAAGDSGVSTASEATAARHHGSGLASQQRTVATMTLAEVCEKHAVTEIDFLSVDVEGHEAQVLAGADWKRWRPRVVVVEATEPATWEEAIDTPRLLVATHDEWEYILLEADYRYAAFDGINRFYVRSEDADLAKALAIPVNFLDGYITYAHSKLQRDLETLKRQQSADWLANQTIRAEFQALALEVDELRARLERAERALTVTRGAYEEIRAEVLATRDLAGAALGQVVETRGSIENIGAMGLGVARRLTAVSNRYPAAAMSLKKVLRAGVSFKRSVSGS